VNQSVSWTFSPPGAGNGIPGQGEASLVQCSNSVAMSTAEYEEGKISM